MLLSRRGVLRVLAASAAAGAGSAALAGCSSRAGRSNLDSRPGEPIRIGTVLPQTGAHRQVGVEIDRGLRLYLNTTSAGLGGRPVQLVTISEGESPDGEKTIVGRIIDGEIDLVVNTPHGSGRGGGSPRVDGYEIRTAAVVANIPCITTVQGLGAAVQGIEAMRAADIGVRSLQDWAPVVVDHVQEGAAGRSAE